MYEKARKDAFNAERHASDLADYWSHLLFYGCDRKDYLPDTLPFTSDTKDYRSDTKFYASDMEIIVPTRCFNVPTLRSSVST